jgi:hypothetical protein
MVEYIFMVCLVAALVCSVAQLCISFYDKGFKAGQMQTATIRRKKNK